MSRLNLNASAPKALEFFEGKFRQLEELVPKPQLVPIMDGEWYRHTEQTAKQVIVQKLAKYVSTLHAAWILLREGFVQEQAALQRILDEVHEDITFLSLGLAQDWTQQHDRFLEYFWEEEFADPDDPEEWDKRRRSVPRRKIRAYLSKFVEGDGYDPHTSSRRLKFLSSVYSGYVHGASPQIMDLCCGSPPKFHLSGMLGTPRIEASEADLWNYFYRGFSAFLLSASAFKARAIFEEAEAVLSHFMQASDHSDFSEETPLG